MAVGTLNRGELSQPGGSHVRLPPAPDAPTRLEARLGGLGPDERALHAVLSPDGTHLAYIAGESVLGYGALYVRALDELEGTLLVSDGASAPFFSPDGRWVAFFVATELRKVPVTGGTPQTLTSVDQGAGWELGSGRDGPSLVPMPVAFFACRPSGGSPRR